VDATQLFTHSEVARLLNADRRRFDRLERLGVVVPDYRAVTPGDSTLYGFDRVVLLAVLQRLEHEGVSYAGRAVFAARYGDDVRAVAGAPEAFAHVAIVADVLGPRLLGFGEPTRGGVAFKFLLAPLVVEIAGRAAALRADTFGEVWSGWRSRPVEEVAAELALT
jgi:hypothetical protein